MQRSLLDIKKFPSETAVSHRREEVEGTTRYIIKTEM